MLRRFASVCIVLVLAAFSAAADAGASGLRLAQDGTDDTPAPQGPKPGDQIRFCGKVVALVESGCIGIVGLASTVELTAVEPRPQIGTQIAGTGIVSDAANMCMQGLHIQPATWSVVDTCAGE